MSKIGHENAQSRLGRKKHEHIKGVLQSFVFWQNMTKMAFFTPRSSEMKRLLHHIIIPAFVLALFLLIIAIPVEVMGCRNRGLIAVTIALVGALSALGAVIKGLMVRIRGDSNSTWWVTSALILMIPALLVIILA